MRRFSPSVALIALAVGVAGLSTSSRAETGQVAVVFTKGGFIVGVGGGEGVLVFRGHRYPFTVSGASFKDSLNSLMASSTLRFLRKSRPSSSCDSTGKGTVRTAMAKWSRASSNLSCRDSATPSP